MNLKVKTNINEIEDKVVKINELCIQANELLKELACMTITAEVSLDNQLQD